MALSWMIRLVNPDVAYARNGRVAIAYEVIGDGPIDVVYLPGFINNLEVMWNNPLLGSFLERLATFCRLIVIDRRGAGLSDRLSPEDLPPLEDLVDDVTAVMDTLGIGRAVLMGSSDCGSLCAMFAAAHPERTAALVLYATAAVEWTGSGFEAAWTDDDWERYLTDLASRWGTLDYARETLGWFDPSVKNDQDLAAWYASFQRLAASPTSAEAIERICKQLAGVRCANSIVEAVRGQGIEIRAGLHTGEVELDHDDVSGIGVTIGARVGAKAGPSEVLGSRTVKDLVAGSGLAFEDAGEHELKGVPERWHLYRMVG
jgi:pimeloyl-ACP methyl ester carboxylesterase